MGLWRDPDAPWLGWGPRTPWRRGRKLSFAPTNRPALESADLRCSLRGQPKILIAAKVRSHRPRVGVAGVRMLRHRLGDDEVEGRGNALVATARRSRHFVDDLIENVVEI